MRPACEQGGAAADSHDPHTTSSSQPDQGNAEADEKATDDLMQAMRASKDDVPPLNVDGVQLFRLTHFTHAQHVSDLLFDPQGPLKKLHDRVREAECSALVGISMIIRSEVLQHSNSLYSGF